VELPWPKIVFVVTNKIANSAEISREYFQMWERGLLFRISKVTICDLRDQLDSWKLSKESRSGRSGIAATSTGLFVRRTAWNYAGVSSIFFEPVSIALIVKVRT
jgi:hypothetical protein